jgi:hypothetical protein
MMFVEPVHMNVARIASPRCGFVFFEQAIQLARLLEGSPVAEAQAYHEYGMFKLLPREREQSLGYLERARELFELVGASAELKRVKAEIRSISA